MTITAPAPPRPVGHPGTARLFLIAGAAFVAAMAYVDPGNFATDYAAGASTGYRLLWVVVVANLVAMFVQSLSAKLGLATGRNLAELCRDHYGTGTRLLLWAQAEIVAMATDVAEVVGGAVALSLLFGIPLLLGGVVVGGVTFILVAVRGRGAGGFEATITALLAVVVVGVGYDALHAGIGLPGIGSGLLPTVSGTDAAVLGVGILGATVMPHVIYLHSALAAEGPRSLEPLRRRGLLHTQRWTIVLALGGAGLVNAAMLLTAAARAGGGDQSTLAAVHETLHRDLGGLAGTAFAVALLCSGLASAGVGTLAGQVVMQGYLRRRIPLLIRRAVTLAPALVTLALVDDPTRVLVISQVVLSFGIPFALIPLVSLTRRADVMGALVNRRATTVVAALLSAAIVAANILLIVESFGLA
jgi:manganese transport protein